MDEDARLDTEFALNVVGTTPLNSLVVSGTVTAEAAGTASKWHIMTSMKNHFYKMKRDIGMADYEKLVKQDFHTPSLYLYFFL